MAVADVAVINGTSSNRVVLSAARATGPSSGGGRRSTDAGPERAELRRCAGLHRRRPGRPRGRELRHVRVTVLSTHIPAGRVQPVVATSPSRPDRSSIETADFNGDGLLDLAAASGAVVTVALRQVGGGFASEDRYAAGDEPAPDSTAGTSTATAARTSRSPTELQATSRSCSAMRPGPAFAARDGRGPRRHASCRTPQRATSTLTDARTSRSATTADDTVPAAAPQRGNDGFTGAAPIAVPDRPIGLAVADFDRTAPRSRCRRASGGRTVLSGSSPETARSLASAYGVAVADFNGDGTARSRGDFSASL